MPILVINDVHIHKDGDCINGNKLALENISISLADGLPVHRNGVLVGRAKVELHEGFVVAQITLKEDAPKNTIDLFASITGRVKEAEDGEIKAFQLDAVSLSENKTHEYELPLVDYKDIHDAKAYIGGVVHKLQKKNWTQRRIKRYIFTKYKFILE